MYIKVATHKIYIALHWFIPSRLERMCEDKERKSRGTPVQGQATHVRILQPTTTHYW
jgi:hypothetical protein